VRRVDLAVPSTPAAFLFPRDLQKSPGEHLAAMWLATQNAV